MFLPSLTTIIVARVKLEAKVLAVWRLRGIFASSPRLFSALPWSHTIFRVIHLWCGRKTWPEFGFSALAITFFVASGDQRPGTDIGHPALVAVSDVYRAIRNPVNTFRNIPAPTSLLSSPTGRLGRSAS